MPSQSGQGAKARHVLAIAGQITVAVVRLLLWPVALVRIATPDVLSALKRPQSFAVRFGVPRGQRASLMLRHHRDLAPLLRLVRAAPACVHLAPAGCCLALASMSALRFSIRAMRGSLLRCPLQPPPPLVVQTTAGGALGANPRALGFCSPPLCRSAPRAASASKKPRAWVLR